MSPAPLVVTDEPRALDPESRTDIIKLLKSSPGRTLLVVTHDPVVKQMAKNVIEMSEGNVKASLRASSHGSFNGAHI
jgi:ABC-type lipoprotein export system ATPase subunit